MLIKNLFRAEIFNKSASTATIQLIIFHITGILQTHEKQWFTDV